MSNPALHPTIEAALAVVRALSDDITVSPPERLRRLLDLQERIAAELDTATLGTVTGIRFVADVYLNVSDGTVTDVVVELPRDLSRQCRFTTGGEADQPLKVPHHLVERMLHGVMPQEWPSPIVTSFGEDPFGTR